MALGEWFERLQGGDAKLHAFRGWYAKWLEKETEEKGEQIFLDPVLLLPASVLDEMKKAFDPHEVFDITYTIAADAKRVFGDVELPATRPVPPRPDSPQAIITFPILVGTDGVKRMGKSLGNYIGLNEPPDEMFGKLMSIPDELIEQYFELCTGVPETEIKQMVSDMKSGALNPRDAKRRLGREIITLYHSAEAAAAADETFRRVFSGARQQTREDYEAVAEEVAIPPEFRDGPVWISTALAALGLAKSKGEATRLVKGGGVYVDERRVSDPQEEVKLAPGMMLRVGKRRVVRLR